MKKRKILIILTVILFAIVSANLSIAQTINLIDRYCESGRFIPEDHDDFGIKTAPLINPDSGLVAYYPFNGNANDESGNDNDGVNEGAVLTTDRFGNLNSAYNFDGSGNHIYLPVDINYNAIPELTIVAWVKPSDVTPIRAVISHDNGGFDRNLNIDSRGGGVGYSCFTGTGVLGYFPAIVDEWIMVAVIYNQLTGTARLYKNLASIPGNTSFGTGWTYTWIGGNPSYNEYFSGIIDDIRLYNRTLSDIEIQALYHEEGWKIKPTFLSELNDRAACLNDSVNFEVIVEGITPINYRWQKDGTDIPGATDNVFIISDVLHEDAGEYKCIATNDYGSDTSNAALLTVEFSIPNEIIGPFNVSESQVATYSTSMQDGHIYEFFIEGGVAFDGTQNSVTVYWGDAGQASVKLLETSELGCIADTVILNVTIGHLGIEDKGIHKLSLSPNPTFDAARLQFTIYEQRLVICDLFNIDGSKIGRLLNEEMIPGSHEVEVDLSDQAGGIYFIRVQAGNNVFTRKLVKIND